MGRTRVGVWEVYAVASVCTLQCSHRCPPTTDDASVLYILVWPVIDPTDVHIPVQTACTCSYLSSKLSARRWWSRSRSGTPQHRPILAATWWRLPTACGRSYLALDLRSIFKNGLRQALFPSFGTCCLKLTSWNSSQMSNALRLNSPTSLGLS